MNRLLAALLACAWSAEPASAQAAAAAPATVPAPAPRERAAGRDDPPPELTSAALKRFVERRANEVRRCYDAALQRDPQLRGKVKLQFNVLPSGAISDVRVTATSFRTPAVPGCVADVFRSWRTPFRPDEPVGIEYPLSFAPRG